VKQFCKTRKPIREIENDAAFVGPPVTLTFDLLTPKVDRFMPLPNRAVVPICTKIGSFVFKILCSQGW